jgi:hypothetical protein
MTFWFWGAALAWIYGGRRRQRRDFGDQRN